MAETKKSKEEEKKKEENNKTAAQTIEESKDGDSLSGSDVSFDDGGSDMAGFGTGPLSLEDIYTKLFDLDGNVDDNNRYLDLKAADINSVQLLEPTLGVTEFVISPKDKVVVNNIPERMAFRFPLCGINEHMIDPKYVNEFCLDYTGFCPTLTIEFIDFNNEMLSTNSIRDGSIIKVYMGGNGDEMYYKPIRQDFLITNIQKIRSGNQNQGDFMQYRLNGKLNVPMGHRKESWSNNAVTSMQELFNLAVYTGLGFATNFTLGLVDEMKWENTLGTTYFEFMQWIADHACYSPNTFFTAFIDQYYVLNFVECHCLLSHGGTKKDTPAMIYIDTQQDEEPSIPDKDKDDGKLTHTDQQINFIKDRYSDLNNPEQKISYYFLSNYHLYNGWSNYIESWNEISDGYSSMDEGYKKHATYADYNSSGLGTNCEFNIYPIDNLPRDPETQEILSLPEKVTQETYIPINLMQTNNEEYQNDELNSVDKMSEVESYDHFGQVDTTNMHKLFFFAECQNTYQMRCMKKCGLRVTLQNFNPGITKFSRIWVDIYDMNAQSNNQIRPEANPDYTDWEKNAWTRVKKQKNENIIYYPDEGTIPYATGKDEEEVKKKLKKNENYPLGNYNRSLSGWYVVTEMKICFDNYDKNMKHTLMLNRIEHKPLFQSEYKTAQQAVEKYKEENKMDYLFQITDDFAYNMGTAAGGGGDQNSAMGGDGSVNVNIPAGASKVVFFGDSVTNDLAAELQKYGNSNGFKVVCSLESGGSRPDHWLRDGYKKMLKSVLDKVNPDVVFMSIGTNNVGNPGNLISDVKQVISNVGKPVVWIGPKYWNGLDEENPPGNDYSKMSYTKLKEKFVETLTSAKSQCSNYVDCYTATESEAKGGSKNYVKIHGGYEGWMKAAVAQMRSSASTQNFVKNDPSGAGTHTMFTWIAESSGTGNIPTSKIDTWLKGL